MIRKTIPVVIAALLFGCSNTAPTVEAGDDVNHVVGEPYFLAPIGGDEDDDVLTYAVTLTAQPSGSTAEVFDGEFSYAGFVPDVAGAYTLTVIVNDGEADSAPDTVTITARDGPISDIVALDAVMPGESVNLDGSGSSVGDGFTLGYQWALVGQPEGSTLDVTDTTATIDYTLAVEGIYDFELAINDGEFEAVESWSVAARNAPVVTIDASAERLFLGQTATLAVGEATVIGPGGDPTYTWAIDTAPATSTATFADPSLVEQTLTPDVIGLYIVSLTINDGVFETVQTINITGEP